MDHHFSRSQFPPGGWIFFQAHTGWTAPLPMANTFDQQVRNIIAHRQKNPAVCIKHKLSTDVIVVGNELEKFTRLRCGIPLPTPPAPTLMLPGMPQSAASSVDEIKRMAFGSSILIDWAESQQPQVDQAVAETRASVCAGCPMNSIGKYEEWLKMPFTAMLKRRVSRLETLRLKTLKDSQLGLCTGLFVPCAVFAHAPAEFAQKKMEKNPSVNTDGSCWLRK